MIANVTVSESHMQCLNVQDEVNSANDRVLSEIHRTDFRTKNCTNSPSVSASFWKTAQAETFTGWPHVKPSTQAMVDAGWFYCRVKDRVLCLYCDTICHQWIEDDDPLEVHRRLGKNCHFLKSIDSQNKCQINSKRTTSVIKEKTLRLSYPSMREVNRRMITFQRVNPEEIKVDFESLAIAGFFYRGIQSTVTCFCCGGSLSKWGCNDNPRIEHIRWFPNCIYAKMLCEPKLVSKVQVLHQENVRKTIEIPDLTRLVNARLDLPIVEKLRKEFSSSIIKRCIEDQWKLAKDDFPSDSAFHFACLILKKQIDVIDGNPEKLIVPSNIVNPSFLSLAPHKKEAECVVCMDRERQVAIIPCGHFSTCTVCAFGLDKCPVCRQNTDDYIRIHPVNNS